MESYIAQKQLIIFGGFSGCLKKSLTKTFHAFKLFVLWHVISNNVAF